VGSVSAGGAGHADGDRVDHLVLTGIPATRNTVGTYNVCTAVAMVTMNLEGNSSAPRRRSHQTLAGTGFT
jgi:hypothetical protein